MPENNMPKAGILTVMVGPPGCGKSTEAKRLSEEYGYSIVSSDSIREELYGDESVQGNPVEVFDAAYERTRKLLSMTGVIFDATNCRREYREKLLDATEGYRKMAIAYVSTASLYDCIGNNCYRSRKVPDGVISRMYDSLWNDPPTTSEGFDSIVWF